MCLVWLTDVFSFARRLSTCAARDDGPCHRGCHRQALGRSSQGQSYVTGQGQSYVTDWPDKALPQAGIPQKQTGSHSWQETVKGARDIFGLRHLISYDSSIGLASVAMESWYRADQPSMQFRVTFTAQIPPPPVLNHSTRPFAVSVHLRSCQLKMTSLSSVENHGLLTDVKITHCFPAARDGLVVHCSDRYCTSVRLPLRLSVRLITCVADCILVISSSPPGLASLWRLLSMLGYSLLAPLMKQLQRVLFPFLFFPSREVGVPGRVTPTVSVCRAGAIC